MPELNRPRILIVDDDASLLDALKRQLRSHFEVTTAPGCNDAMRLVMTQGPYAVIVTDLRMPGMNGVTLLYLVRRAAPDTVRVLLTGHVDLEAAISAVNDGNVFRVLIKPCPAGALLRALEAAVEQYELARKVEPDVGENSVRR